MKKVMLISGLGMVFFLSVFFNSILNSMDSAVHISIERYASRILQVPVRVKRVDINPFDGTGVIEGISVESPMGFDSPYVIRLNKILVKLDINTTGDDVVIVKEVIFDRAKIFYEVKENISNLEMIDQNIMSQQILVDRRVAGESDHADKKQKEKLFKLIIDNVHIKNTDVVLVNHPSGEKNKTLPAIHLQNIGKDSDGATPMEVTWPVISNLTEGIVSMLEGTSPVGNIRPGKEHKKVIFSSSDNVQQPRIKKSL